MALPTKGRVIIDTTAGEIDVELWSKVCDKQPVDCGVFHEECYYRKHQRRVETSLRWHWKVGRAVVSLVTSVDNVHRVL